MKVSSKRGLEIIEQGKKQFMAAWEDYNCPFDERRQPVERKLWLKGFHEAKIKWYKPMEDRKRFAARKQFKGYGTTTNRYPSGKRSL